MALPKRHGEINCTSVYSDIGGAPQPPSSFRHLNRAFRRAVKERVSIFIYTVPQFCGPNRPLATCSQCLFRMVHSCSGLPFNNISLHYSRPHYGRNIISPRYWVENGFLKTHSLISLKAIGRRGWASDWVWSVCEREAMGLQECGERVGARFNWDLTAPSNVVHRH